MTNENFNRDLRNLVRAFKIYQTGVRTLSKRSGLTQEKIDDLVGSLTEYIK